MYTMIALAASLLFSLVGNAHATPIPFGTPADPYAGFTADVGTDPSLAVIATNASDAFGNTITAPSGDPMLVLTAGSLVTGMHQTFDAIAGTLSFEWFASSAEGSSLLRNDTVAVRLNGAVYILSSDTALRNAWYRDSGWMKFSLAIPDLGPLEIDFTAVNSINEYNPIQLSVVGLNVPMATVSSVPEPGTLAMFGIGLAGVIGARRRQI